MAGKMVDEDDSLAGAVVVADCHFGVGKMDLVEALAPKRTGAGLLPLSFALSLATDVCVPAACWVVDFDPSFVSHHPTV